MTDLETRRRRAAYRATHRGTKEMDWLLGRYGVANLAGMSELELEVFERLLALPDPDLQSWILGGEVRAENEHSGLVAAIRAFHGLGEGGSGRLGGASS